MAKTIQALRRVSVCEEPNASFAVLTSLTFVPVPAVADSLSWTHGQKMLDPNTLQQYQHGKSQLVVGPRTESTLSMKVPLFTTGTLANVATSTLTRADSAGLLLLDLAFGGSAGTGSQGSAASGVPTADVITVTDGSSFVEGGCIGWINSAGLMELREISTITATHTLTLKNDLSAAPAAADVIYNGITFFPSKKSSPTSLQFLVEGEEADDYWRLMGCMPTSIGFELAWGEIPHVVYEFAVTDWDYLGSGSLAGMTYSNFNPLAYNSGELLIQTVATSTRNVVQHHSFSLESSLTYLPVTSPNGVQGRVAWIQNHTPPFFTAKVGTYYEDQTWYDARSNRTLKSVFLQMGMSSAGGVLLSLPTSQVSDVTAPSDANGLTGSEVTFVSLLDTDTSGQGSERLRAAGRLHIVG